jgi:hypothetical protein
MRWACAYCAHQLPRWWGLTTRCNGRRNERDRHPAVVEHAERPARQTARLPGNLDVASGGMFTVAP